jgi:hypothetical protein
MANVDYVTVGAGPSRVDVAEAVKATLDITDVEENRLYIADERVELRVSPSGRWPGGTTVHVYHAGADEAQTVLARRIYDYLVEHTDWDLMLDSDNSQEILASRIKMRR